MFEISVIIPTLNNKEKLAILLNSLYMQTLRKEYFEVIIVDDGSSDGTEDMVRNKQKHDFDLIYIKITNCGPGVARNRGADLAKGSIFAFIDSDCFPSKHWLEEIRREFSNSPNTQFIYGTVESNMPNLPPFIHSFRFINREPNGANLAIRKDCFYKLNGFDPLFSRWSEDWDFFLRAKKSFISIMYSKKLIVYHPPIYQKYSFRRGLVSVQSLKLLDVLIKRHPELKYIVFYSSFFERLVLKFSTIIFIFLFPASLFFKIFFIFAIFFIYGFNRVVISRLLIRRYGTSLKIKFSDALYFSAFNWLRDFYNFFIILIYKFMKILDHFLILKDNSFSL